MAASQATMGALKRESRANAKEDMVDLTSGARQKVDNARAGAQELLGKIAHPLDKGAREAATSKANGLRRQSSEKQANIREMARQMAEDERAAARTQVAQQVLGGAGGMRYPVPVPPPPTNSAAEHANKPDQQPAADYQEAQLSVPSPDNAPAPTHPSPSDEISNPRDGAPSVEEKTV